MYLLKGGQLTHSLVLDRVRRVDIRSLNYPISEVLPAEAYRFRANTWPLNGPVLDQGVEGACVGYALAHELMATPAQVSGVTGTTARGIYWEAQRNDPWRGGSYPGSEEFYEGTDVLSGLATMKKFGRCREYRHCLSIEDVMATGGFHGPVILGIDVFTGMFSPDELGYIRPTGLWEGGHALLANKFRPVFERDGIGRLDYMKSWLGGPNSWGRGYGLDGYWRMYLADFMKLWPGADASVLLFRRGGEVDDRGSADLRVAA